MRVSLNAIKHSKKYARSSPATSVVPYTRQDLTKRWMGRIQAKAKDSHSQETYMKLNSLIDYYNKPAQTFKEDIDWGYWKDNVRSEGLVDKIREKYDQFKTYSYNIDSIAQRSALNSENYDNYGLLLKWNYHLWMTQYLYNIKSLNGLEALGDVSYLSSNEVFSYLPTIRENNSGWRETGHYVRCK
jgi:hypothetical protein